MGTNYYAHVNTCECCGRFDQLHIGRSRHILRAYAADEMPDGTAITSWADWCKWIAASGARIVSEYGDACPDVLDQWLPYPDAADESNSAWAARFGHGLGDYTDPDGFHMSPREFS